MAVHFNCNINLLFQIITKYLVIDICNTMYYKRLFVRIYKYKINKEIIKNIGI
jgi:hypothetical protein